MSSNLALNVAGTVVIATQAGFASIAFTVWKGYKVNFSGAAILFTLPIAIYSTINQTFDGYNKNRHEDEKISHKFTCSVSGALFTFCFLHYRTSLMPLRDAGLCMLMGTVYAIVSSKIHHEIDKIPIDS